VKYTLDCTRLHTPSLLDCTLPITLDGTLPACSTYALKYALKTLSSILLSMLLNTLPIALDDTLPARITICSQVSSQVAPRYTLSSVPSTPPSTFSSTLPGMLSRYTPKCTRWHTPACLTVRSQVSAQVHIPARSPVRSQLHSRGQASAVVRLVASGGQCLADGRRRVPGGVWDLAHGVCWPKS